MALRDRLVSSGKRAWLAFAVSSAKWGAGSEVHRELPSAPAPSEGGWRHPSAGFCAAAVHAAQQTVTQSPCV